MEDGSNDSFPEVEVLDHTKNGVVSPIMAKFPGGSVAVSKEEKVHNPETPILNGGSVTDCNVYEDNSYSSESDALIIDESVPKKHKKPTKISSLKEEATNKDGEIVTHSNPYFNESLFELSQLHHEQEDKSNDTNNSEGKTNESKQKLKKGKAKSKPKLREYAQYLGLQPTVQFKCSKCGRAGFETLSTLQEHIVQCSSESLPELSSENSCSGFKLTRKVFLCSACGTYYENWNLYMHMLKFHRRYICLYCLGMFSLLDDLCQHIQSRHNLEPGHKSTLDEFFNAYNDPCYVVCCECNKLFNEQDNFFYHNCVNNKNKSKKPVKTQITPENHVTGETETMDHPYAPLPNNLETIEENDEKINNNSVMETSDKDLTSIKEKVVENCQESEQIDKDCIKCEENNVLNDMCQNLTGVEEVSDKMNEIDQQDTSTDYSSEIKTTEKLKDNDKQLNSSEAKAIVETPVEIIDNLKGIAESEKMSNVTETRINVETQMDSTEPLMNTNDSDTEEKLDDEIPPNEDEELVETRKVPKLSLKLPKPSFYEEPDDSDDSEKLNMEVDQIESESEADNKCEINHLSNPEPDPDIEVEEKLNNDPGIQVAGPDVSIIELELEQPLDKFDPRMLLQKCLKTTVPTCIYCNHARKIAVNGRQLALHCISEHRFSAIVNSITAEELIPQSFVNRIKECLDELQLVFFNLESSFSNEAITFSHVFECFQCHFSTTVHKELYLHNRKFHSKNLLLCIMCKSNFYSYSELICHLCPGLYVLDYDTQFRCCMCVNDDLPSSFRLMVHLRKRHNVCDVCLETCHSQYRLSNHVWKHKLHHFCYRCGIAYRNKPDITRHLFWKHGTESVMCRKCMQKKWPHVFHFCVPPTSFTCDECSLTFSRAISLKVHKRLHTNETKYACTYEGCEQKFISKKLMWKHEARHREPLEEVKAEEKSEAIDAAAKEEREDDHKGDNTKEEERPEEKPKPKIDVLDLPALNLSESDSDSETEATDIKSSELKSGNDEESAKPTDQVLDANLAETVTDETENTSVIQNIWDNFKNYQESKHKLGSMFSEPEKSESVDIPIPEVEEFTMDMALRDHDYCANPEPTTDTSVIEVKPALTISESVDHDYCSLKSPATVAKTPPIEPEVETVKQEEIKQQKKATESTSNSSSDSDSSSCSCGSNCSCSSTSGSSSSSSDSSNSDSSTEEGRKKQQARKQKRKDRAKKLKANENKVVDVVTTDAPPVIIETPIRESDLETTESETDEEFYDRAPQKLAKKILEEKRQQLLATMGPNSVPDGGFIESTSRPPTPPGVLEEEERKKKKSKSKKRKKRRNERREHEHDENAARMVAVPPDIPIPSYYQQFHQQQQQQLTLAPITLSLLRSSPVPSQSSVTTVAPLTPSIYPKVHTESLYMRHDSSDLSLRASKRRRVPNKFYGYSSDEEQDNKLNQNMPKWRKIETPQTPRSPMVVPPITIKAAIPQPPAPPPQPTVEPISIRTGIHLSDFRVQRPRPKPVVQPFDFSNRDLTDKDTATDSNDSSSEELPTPPKPNQPQLYCYCRCPYDEVSEMIGCDASDCAIEWFHFECVGIMVPPKGQWFCPDCRKKKQQKAELFRNIN